jgi:hypothetical protein
LTRSSTLQHDSLYRILIAFLFLSHFRFYYILAFGNLLQLHQSGY